MGYRLLSSRATKFLAMMLLVTGNVLSPMSLVKPTLYPFLQFCYGNDKTLCCFTPNTFAKNTLKGVCRDLNYKLSYP